MDIVTHGLASFAVARGFFPRAGKVAVFSALLAGTVADLDWLSVYGGPATFLAGHRSSLHSIVAAFFLTIAIVVVSGHLANRWYATRIPLGNLGKDETIPEEPAARRIFLLRRFFAYLLGAPICAALLHLAMDTCQSDGVMLLWPISSRRFAADWLPGIDPWILTILIACIALPELLHLVSSEIGAKSKKPRGQTGAIIGLALVFVYVGARAILHSNVVALMESRTFHGETPRRVSVFPEALSILAWHGVVETESAVSEIDVDAASPQAFDADSSVRQFKPDPSPALDAARNTIVARRFLATAQIPKASLEKTEAGYVVVLRDLRYAAAGETAHEVAAVIELDLNNKVTSQELVWARDLRH
ncbi:MAG TPA: metal-dependent hydrolase [Candidatus Acidoferrum sp.]|nr:metal-dependent hydrolase [Candidatus Acidoferrum sp.]